MERTRNYKRNNSRQNAYHSASAVEQKLQIPGSDASAVERKLPVPGCDDPKETIFDFPFLHESDAIEYLKKHGRIMFIIRGPPGTGKDSLGDMLTSQYPSGKMFSAKLYFCRPLSEPRSKEATKKSHSWCRQHVEDACKKNVPVIIVKNTNVRKWEINTYFVLAKTHQYTVIIADTTKKFSFDSETLAKSNNQGLTKEYFDRRLSGWEELNPWYTGWFLNPADSCWLFDKLTETLSALMKLPEFESNFDISYGYENERELFCIAAFCQGYETSHFLDQKIQAEIGKMFNITVEGFLLTSKMMLALVSLSDEQMHLSEVGMENRNLSETDLLAQRMYNISISNLIWFSTLENKLLEPLPESTLTVEPKKGENRNLFVRNSSYIVIKRSKNASFPYIKNVNSFNSETLSDVVEEDVIHSDKFTLAVDNFKACHVKDDVWLINLDEKYVTQSVFTGLYFE